MPSFSTIRNITVTLSQITGAVACSYYIYNVRYYEVSWNLLTWLMPMSILNRINYSLATTGTTILIIPLAIIILSFLIPQSFTLRIIGSFFGIASTLMIITSGAFRNTLGEVYNMRVFLITKTLSLTQKVDIFKQKFNSIIDEIHLKNIELAVYLKEHLSEKYFALYLDKIKELKESTAIQEYASIITKQLQNSWELTQKITTTTPVANNMWPVYFKYALIGVAILTAAVFLRAFLNLDAVEEGAKLMRTGAELNNTGANIMYDTTVIVSDVVQKVKDAVPAIIQEQLRDALKPTADSFKKVDETLTILTERSNDVTHVTSMIMTKLTEAGIIET